MAALLRRALTLSSLRTAWERVEQNNGQAGVDGVTVEQFASQRTLRIGELQNAVVNGSYKPQPLLRVWLPREGRAARPLGIPTVADRLLQTAVAQTINSLLEAEFEDCSFAYRQGRSVRMAVERIGMLQRQGFQWVVEADIERFFDCIPHKRLLAELQTVVADTELVTLVASWLQTPVNDAGKLLPTTIGVPQGSPISPLLANLYLDHLDDALLDENLALVRYADDFIVLTKNRERAEDAIELTHSVLQELELKLNPLKTRVVNFETGFNFLGWNFVRSLAVPAKAQHDTATKTVEQVNKLDTNSATQAQTPEHSLSFKPKAKNSKIGGELQAAFLEAFAEQPLWRPAEEKIETVPQAESEPLHEPIPELVPEPIVTTETEPNAPLLPPPSLQRTLYLIDPAASLCTENRHLLVRKDTEVVLDLPAVNVDQVMLFGRNHVTPAALVCCAQHGIPVAYLSRMGKFYGRFEPASQDSSRLQAAQFAQHTSGLLDLPLAREFVRGKLSNSMMLLHRYARHRTAEQNRYNDSMATLRSLVLRLKTSTSLEELRGFEGAGAAAYFAVWRSWLIKDWHFGARQQQDGADPINSLLDFGYSLLYQSVAGLLQARGLSPWIGHLHRPSSGHMALASDVMEEFRALAVDSVVMNACLNRRIKKEDFILQEKSYTLRPEPARWFVREIEMRLNSEMKHPRTGDLMDLRRIMDNQIRTLAGCYRQASAQNFESCIFR
jgi:CRISPR-associated protein Cas1